MYIIKFYVNVVESNLKPNYKTRNLLLKLNIHVKYNISSCYQLLFGRVSLALPTVVIQKKFPCGIQPVGFAEVKGNVNLHTKFGLAIMLSNWQRLPVTADSCREIFPT